MKNLGYNILLLCILAISTTAAQDNLKPSGTHSLIRLKMQNPDNSTYANKKVVFNSKKGTSLTATTNKEGILQILLPINDSYTTSCENLTNDKPIKLGNRANWILSGGRYTMRFIDYTFEYKNDDEEPVAGEEVTIKSNTGKIYKETTNENGEARFYLPIQNSYKVSVAYHPDLREINIEDQGQARTTTGFTFRWMGAIAKVQFDKERAEEEKQWEEEQRIQDSIRASQPTTIIFFATNPEHKGVGTITVYDGGKDGIIAGEVTAVWNCLSGPNESKAETKIIKMKGTYKYYAKSSKGIEWEGTYEVLGSGTHSIPLRITSEDLKKIKT